MEQSHHDLQGDITTESVLDGQYSIHHGNKSLGLIKIARDHVSEVHDNEHSITG
jgi:hypothetical protein